MNKLLFNLLHSIHQHKTDSRAIAFLLNKLYRPVLWRQFDCANGLVKFTCFAQDHPPQVYYKFLINTG